MQALILLRNGRERKKALAPVREHVNSLRKSSGKSGRGGKKLVAINPRGDAFAPVVRLDAHDFREAANVHIAGHGNLAGQCEDKLNAASRIVIGVDQEVE